MYIRKWLNKEGRAFIEIKKGDGFGSGGGGGTVTIGDCDRRVTLDFYIYEKKDFKPKLAKLNILINSLQELKNLVLEQQEKSE